MTDENLNLIVEPPLAEDWPVIERLFSQKAYASVPEGRRAKLTPEQILESFQRESAGLKGPQSPPNQPLVARNTAGKVVGATWILAMRTGFDQRPTGLLMDLCVERAHRDPGIVRQLLAGAETWAKGMGFQSLQLGATPGAYPDQDLLAEMGWTVEKFELGKDI